MPKNVNGGGANTNAHGLKFEQETSLKIALTNEGFSLNEVNVSFSGNNLKECDAKEVCNANKILLGYALQKYELYYYFDLWKNKGWNKYISKILLPDDAFYNVSNKTVYIVEKKWQEVCGSVDEKLQTCDFKKEEYKKLLKHLKLNVEYIYVLNDYFNDSKYEDVKKYIKKKKCKFFYNILPLSEIGL